MTAPLPEDAFEPRDRAGWRAWLQANHARSKGVWLALRKKSAGPVNLTLDDAVEEALCFGWIDSKPRKLDDARSLLYIAPRKAGSGWSGVNKARIERVLAAGLMAPAGQAKIDAAKADGSWGKLDTVDAPEVPSDLETALLALDGAHVNFSAFPRSARRGILEWIGNAKRPETRAAQIGETARLAARNERANQWRKRK